MKIETFVLPVGEFSNTFFIEGCPQRVDIGLQGVLKIFIGVKALTYLRFSKKVTRCQDERMAQQLVSQFRWEKFDHPAYSPCLPLTGFHLLQELNTSLGGQRFHPNKNLEDALETYLNTLAATFYEEGIEKLAHRYDKCLNFPCDYVEK